MTEVKAGAELTPITIKINGSCLSREHQRELHREAWMCLKPTLKTSEDHFIRLRVKEKNP